MVEGRPAKAAETAEFATRDKPIVNLDISKFSWPKTMPAATDDCPSLNQLDCLPAVIG
jgi:hypothetical protein